MLESGWLFLGRMAFVWTLLVVAGAVYIDPTEDDDLPLIIAAVLGLLLWLLWSFGALQVETASNGEVIEVANPQLLVVGIMLAIVNVYFAIEGPITAITRYRDTEPEDF